MSDRDIYRVTLKFNAEMGARLPLYLLYCFIYLEKTKYILVSWDQNAGQIREIKIGNRSFENVSQFKHLGMTVTNQNLIKEEIKKRLNSGNACYHSVQNLSSSRLLEKI
jgi:hypothetical protein